MYRDSGLPPPEKNIDALENIQKFALKVCCKMNYEDLLGLTNIQSLSTRTQILCLLRLYIVMLVILFSPLLIDMLGTVTIVIILVYQPFAHNFCF